MLKQPTRHWIARLPKAWEEEINAGLHARFFIVHESGPLKFTLRDQDGATFRVTLGSAHSCSCRPTDCGKRSPGTSVPEETFASVCKHIVWSLHRRLRIDQASPLLYQTGLAEHELQHLSSSLSRKSVTPECPQAGDTAVRKSKKEVAGVAQRPVDEGDVCPICQETFASSTTPLCYCKNSCGNNVHIPCMKLVAEHQSKTLGRDIISCPLCRSDFASVEELKEMDKEWSQVKRTETIRKSRQNTRKRQLPPLHVGVHCRSCTKPVRGRRYRCSTCTDEYSLCSNCFQDDTRHTEHPFQFKDDPKTSFWTFAKRYVKPQLPDQTVHELQSRDLTDQDYQDLLDLDSAKVVKGYSRLHVVGMFPLMRVKGMNRVRTLLGSGYTSETCHICLGAICEGEVLRKLPCSHSRFHQDCVDRWLLTCSTKCPECDEHVVCPVDNSNDHFIPIDIDIDPEQACPWTRALQYVAAERKRNGIDSMPRRSRHGGAGSPHEHIVPRKAAAADAHRAVPADDSRMHPSLPALFSSLLVVSSIGHSDSLDSGASTGYGSAVSPTGGGSGSIIRGSHWTKSSASRLSLPPLSALGSTTSSARTTRSSVTSRNGDLSLAGTPMQGSARQDRKTTSQQNHPPRLYI